MKKVLMLILAGFVFSVCSVTFANSFTVGNPGKVIIKDKIGSWYMMDVKLIRKKSTGKNEEIRIDFDVYGEFYRMLAGDKIVIHPVAGYWSKTYNIVEADAPIGTGELPLNSEIYTKSGSIFKAGKFYIKPHYIKGKNQTPQINL